jgi:hypothetical protein
MRASKPAGSLSGFDLAARCDEDALGYVNSGYCGFGGRAGNVLLALGLDTPP